MLAEYLAWVSAVVVHITVDQIVLVFFLDTEYHCISFPRGNQVTESHMTLSDEMRLEVT